MNSLDNPQPISPRPLSPRHDQERHTQIARVVSVNQDAGIGPGRAKGATVHLSAMREAFRDLGAEVIPVDESDRDRTRSRLDAIHRERAIDLIYERYALGQSAAARFSVEHGIPLVLEVNAPLAREAARWRGKTETDGERQEDRYLFANATRLLAVSHPVAAYARERGAREETVHVVPNGVSPDRFRPRLTSDPLRREIVPQNRFALGFHGRLRPWHGLPFLAETCARLLAAGAPIHLVIVGKGDFGHSLEGLVPSANRTLVDWVPHAEVGRYVACFDALPLTYGAGAPCYFSPLKLAEAMACGVVPIVPRLGDLPGSIRENIDGLVYPAGDLLALVATVNWLIAHPEARTEMAARAVEAAHQNSWQRIAALALELAA